VRGDGEQHPALAQRFGDEADLAVLEVAEPAVDQLAAGRARGRSKVSLLDEHHAQAPARSIARNSRAVDAAADDE
jgi:hypothetical protein